MSSEIVLCYTFFKLLAWKWIFNENHDAILEHPEKTHDFRQSFDWLSLHVVQDLYMSLYAFHLGQIISTVLGQVDHDGQHGTLPEPQSGVKRPKLTTPKNDAFAILLSTKP